jgi:hypothetical protein
MTATAIAVTANRRWKRSSRSVRPSISADDL